MKKRYDRNQRNANQRDSKNSKHLDEDLHIAGDRIRNIGHLYQPSDDAIRQQRVKLFNTIRSDRRSVTSRRVKRINLQNRLQPQRRFAMSWALILIIIFALAGGTGAVYASSETTPGDMLYPVKIATEDMQLFFNNDTNDVGLHLEFMDERLEEMQTLADEENVDGINVALDGYVNHMELLTKLLSKRQPDEAFEGDSLQAKVQSKLTEQARIMQQIQEQVREQIKTQDKVQEKSATKDQSQSGDGQQQNQGEVKGSGQDDEAVQGQDSGGSGGARGSAKLHGVQVNEDGSIDLQFNIDDSQKGNVYVKIDGSAYACSGNSGQYQCKGKSSGNDSSLVELYDSRTGQLLFSKWLDVRGKHGSGSGGSDASGQNGGSGRNR